MSVRYSEDGTVLISAEIDPDKGDIIVSDGCRIIARKAFMYQANLKKIIFPKSLERIEDFALSCTSLSEVSLPEGVTSVGSKAFYQCKQLTSVRLNKGLQKIGDEAFAQTALNELSIPSSVHYLGLGFITNTPLAQQEGVRGLHVSAENPFYHRDDFGGIYRHTRVGTVFSELTSQVIESHHMEEAVFAIAQGAYMRCNKLRDAHIPAGTKILGKRAFDRVETLQNVELPQSLEFIGDCAFRRTSLQNLRIPRDLKHIGESALLTGRRGAGTIQNIAVDPENTFFFVEKNFLIQRQPWGSGHALTFYGLGERVVIPHSVQTIGAYCIACSQPIKNLVLHGGLTRIHPLAVAPHCRVEEVLVQLNRSFCGSKIAVIPFLDKRTFFSPTYSLFPTGNVNVYYLFTQSDQITYMSHKTYLRAKTMLDRLACPQYLSEKYRSLFTEALTRKIYEVCIEFSNHEYLEGFERLKDFGFINQFNIAEIIERIRCVDNVVVTSYLLEMRREYFSGNNLQEDFSL